VTARVSLLSERLLRVDLPSCRAAQGTDTGCPNAHVYLSLQRHRNRPLSFHPFTVLPAGSDGALVAYVRSCGPWTRALAQHASVELCVEGALQSEWASDVAPDEAVLLVGGGTGIVPLLGILRRRTELCCGAATHLVLVARDPEDAAMLEALPQVLGDGVEVAMYVTGGMAVAARVEAAAAFRRRRPASRRPAAAAPEAARSVLVHSAALAGLVAGDALANAIDCGGRRWLLRLAVALTANASAVLAAVAAAALFDTAAKHLRGRPARALGTLEVRDQIGIDLQPFVGEADRQCHVVPGRPDMAALVEDFAQAAARRGDKCRVLSAGPRPLLDAVGAGARGKAGVPFEALNDAFT
jgi:hypothetical protein